MAVFQHIGCQPWVTMSQNFSEQVDGCYLFHFFPESLLVADGEMSDIFADMCQAVVPRILAHAQI